MPRRLRTLLENAGKIVPKAKGNEQFGHHEHRSEQQVNGIVHERGLATFEDPVPDQAPKLDLITLVLNYHDITYLPVDRAKMNQRLFAALKPGGHFVVIDHSAKTGADISVGKTLHRIDEAIVLAEVRKAGFVLEADSDFLRDPADTREESSGDAKIPTDKFALRFVKP